MSKDMSPSKSSEKSFTFVIVASFVIAVLMPFVRAVVRDGEVSAFAAPNAPLVATSTLPGDRADEVSMLAVGAFLLGLGSVLRRVA
jgi:hypothetical protein